MNIFGILFILISYLVGIIFNLNTFNYSWVALSTIIFYNIVSEGLRILKGGRVNISLFVFLIFYFVLMILEPLTSIISNGVISYSIKFGDLRNSSLLISGLAHTIFVLIVFWFQESKHMKKAQILHIKTPQLSLALIFCLTTLVLLGLYPYLRNGWGGFIQTLILSRSETNSQFVNTGMASSDFAVHLTTLLISVGSICGYYLTYSKSSKRIYKISVIILLGVCIIVVGSSGTRTRIILLMTPIISYILFIRSKGIKKIKIKKIFILTTMSVLFLSFMAEFRTKGFNSIRSENSEILNFDGLDLNNEFIYIIEHFEKPINDRNFLQSLIYPIPEQFVKFITNPIPRKYFPNKYLDPSFAKFNEKRIGKSGLDETFNITPTIFGRFYLLYGLIGIIYMSIFIGYSLKKINSNIDNETRMFTIFLNFCVLAFLCQSIRDLSPGWLYAFIFVFLINKLFRYFKVDA